MPDKDLSFNRTLQRIVTPSIFDTFVKEMDVSEVPLKYIEKVVVYYLNGNIVELDGKDVENPLPFNRKVNVEELSKPFREMSEVKVFIDICSLETDVNTSVDYFLGNKC